jgi:hypothetical protein
MTDTIFTTKCATDFSNERLDIDDNTSNNGKLAFRLYNRDSFCGSVHLSRSNAADMVSTLVKFLVAEDNSVKTEAPPLPPKSYTPTRGDPAPRPFEPGDIVHIPGVGERMLFAGPWGEHSTLTDNGRDIAVASFGDVTRVENHGVPDGLIFKITNYGDELGASIVEYLALVRPMVFSGLTSEDIVEMTKSDGWWLKRNGGSNPEKMIAPRILEDGGIDFVNSYTWADLELMLRKRYS